MLSFSKTAQKGASIFNMKKLQKQVADKSETLTKLIETYNAEVAPVLDGYSGMIIALRYVSASTWKTVKEFVKYYSRRQIYRIHDAALARLEKMALDGT
jgi:DNA-directed RNA polymerase specialized sigma subunit